MQISRKNVLSILYLSIDTRNINKFYKSRLNAIIINTVNSKTSQTTMTSRPKNLKIKYEGKTMPRDQRYNHSGIPVVIKYVQKEMKILVDYYVFSNMQCLTKTVNQVGDINIMLIQIFTNYGMKFQISKLQMLNQGKTLVYLREYDNDYQCQLHNKQVLLALFDEITHDSLNTSTTTSFNNYIRIDLSFNVLKCLALHYLDAVQNKHDLLFDGNNFQMKNVVILIHQSLEL